MKRFFLRVLGELASPSPRLKRAWPFLVFVIVLVAVFSRPFFALATGYEDNTETQDTLDKILGLLAGLVTTMASVVGNLIVLLIGYVLIPVMTYNEFSTSPVVGMGWSVVRDAVNMFFVLVLIVIAFGTILGYDKFKWRQHVPRLLITAVVINFSRTLCGLAIDLSQVVMLTFVNAIKDIAGGNFLQMFGVRSMLEADKASELLTSTSGISGSDIFIASVTSLIMLLIVLITLLFLMIILAYRVVVLWALVTVAPLAWFTKTLGGFTQGGDKGYTSWWKKFICALQVGPVLVFFLWLALAVAGSGSIGDSGFVQSTVDEASALKNPTLLQALGRTQLVSFVIGILLLFVGFDAANDACAGGDSVVSGLIGKAKSFSKPVAMAPAAITAFGAKRAWRGASGGGGIKGKVLGSGVVTKATMALGRAPILRFLGGSSLADVAGKNMLESKKKREKYQQDRASTIAKASGLKDMSDEKLEKYLASGSFGKMGSGSSDPMVALAALQLMMDRGLFKDDPSLTQDQRNQRIANINQAREKLSDNPEALEAFDNKIRKQSPGLALDTIYRDKKSGDIDSEKLRQDVASLKIGAGAILSGTNSGNAAAVAKALGDDGAQRMAFLYDIFDGNIKNITSAIGGIEESQIKNAMFGDIGSHVAQTVGNCLKAELDTSGADTGRQTVDFNKLGGILSALTSNGVDIGMVGDFYKNPGGGVVFDAQAAKKSQTKQVNSQADAYREIFEDKLDSGDATKIASANNQIKKIFEEIGDTMSGEAVNKLKSGGNNLRNAVDSAVNDSLNVRAINWNAATGALKTELEKQLKEATEKAVKGGAAINFPVIFGGAAAAAVGVVKDKIGESKLEDLNKMKFHSSSKNEVGDLMWGSLDTATMKKIFESATNRKLMEAIRATASAYSSTSTHAAIAEYL